MNLTVTTEPTLCAHVKDKIIYYLFILISIQVSVDALTGMSFPRNSEFFSIRVYGK